MSETLAILAALGIPSGVLSMTVTRGTIFDPMRNWIETKVGEDSPLMMLITCPWCFSHWVCLVAHAIWQPAWLVPGPWAVANFLVNWFVMVAFAAIGGFIIYRSYTHE